MVAGMAITKRALAARAYALRLKHIRLASVAPAHRRSLNRCRSRLSRLFRHYLTHARAALLSLLLHHHLARKRCLQRCTFLAGVAAAGAQNIVAYGVAWRRLEGERERVASLICRVAKIERRCAMPVYHHPPPPSARHEICAALSLSIIIIARRRAESERAA